MAPQNSSANDMTPCPSAVPEKVLRKFKEMVGFSMFSWVDEWHSRQGMSQRGNQTPRGQKPE